MAAGSRILCYARTLTTPTTTRTATTTTTTATATPTTTTTIADKPQTFFRAAAAAAATAHVVCRSTDCRHDHSTIHLTCSRWGKAALPACAASEAKSNGVECGAVWCPFGAALGIVRVFD